MFNQKENSPSALDVENQPPEIVEIETSQSVVIEQVVIQSEEEPVITYESSTIIEQKESHQNIEKEEVIQPENPINIKDETAILQQAIEPKEKTVSQSMIVEEEVIQSEKPVIVEDVRYEVVVLKQKAEEQPVQNQGKNKYNRTELLEQERMEAERLNKMMQEANTYESVIFQKEDPKEESNQSVVVNEKMDQSENDAEENKESQSVLITFNEDVQSEIETIFEEVTIHSSPLKLSDETDLIDAGTPVKKPKYSTKNLDEDSPQIKNPTLDKTHTINDISSKNAEKKPNELAKNEKKQDKLASQNKNSKANSGMASTKNISKKTENKPEIQPLNKDLIKKQIEEYDVSSTISNGISNIFNGRWSGFVRRMLFLQTSVYITPHQ